MSINKISCNSQAVAPGDLFVAVRGASYDGHRFIQEAIDRGAGIVVLEDDKKFRGRNDKTVLVKVSNSRLALAELAANFYGNPSRRLKVIGITGTNGKTTVSYLLEKILSRAGFGAGVIGTINYKIKNKVLPAKNTTPGPLELQSYLAQMVKKNIKFCAMEVSSHSLDQDRVGGIDFAGAIFTNLASDHLDYHLNVENYFAAKARLFKNLNRKAFAAINLDDKFASRLLKLTKAKTVTYAIDKSADFTAKDISLGLNGSRFCLCAPLGKIGIETKLVGRHNIYNILAAASLCWSLGLGLKTIKKGVANLKLVPGRLERLKGNYPFEVLVDFAHTEDALKKVLFALRQISKSRILLVFGCGGDRDKTKRKKMGRVADRLADFSFVTSDNPRNENPRAIVEQIIKGFTSSRYKVIIDRKAAIKEAVMSARKNDILVIAGKGHETSQIFKNKTISFDDRLVAKKILDNRSFKK